MTNARELVARMTLEEKCSLLSGADFWHTRSIDRLGVKGVMYSDGPHGLRKQDQTGDHLGINDSIKAVCFPAACGTTASFDVELVRLIGEAIGRECQHEEVAVNLGPAINIKRNPLCLKQRVHQPHVAVVIIAFCHLFQYITTISFRIRQVLLP